MSRLGSRTFAATAAAVIATMVAGLGIAAGSSGGGATVASLEQQLNALNRQVKDVSLEVHHEFHESGELVRVFQSIIERVDRHTRALREPNVRQGGRHQDAAPGWRRDRRRSLSG